jgi:hypothetical protein
MGMLHYTVLCNRQSHQMTKVQFMPGQHFSLRLGLCYARGNGAENWLFSRDSDALLSELKKKDLIKLEGSTLVIKNRTALEAMAV